MENNKFKQVQVVWNYCSYFAELLTILEDILFVFSKSNIIIIDIAGQNIIF